MKVIISHDVDHITVWEHKKDLIIPKFLLRSIIEFGYGYTSTSVIMSRFKNIIQNKWQSLEELLEFDKENDIFSTFFIGVSNGKGLEYSKKDSEYWIKKILQEGLNVGVHGIAFDNFDDIKNEYDTLKNLSGLGEIGIRMHYLRNSNNTLEFLSEAGYMYDTTLYSFKNPFKIDRLWEFPLHIMDGYVFLNNTKWQNQNLNQAKDTTKRIIETAFSKGLNYLTILFHDRYFDYSFMTWKEWYIWLISYLRDNKFEFISYREAINELEEFPVK